MTTLEILGKQNFDRFDWGRTRQNRRDSKTLDSYSLRAVYACLFHYNRQEYSDILKV